MSSAETILKVNQYQLPVPVGEGWGEGLNDLAPFVCVPSTAALLRKKKKPPHVRPHPNPLPKGEGKITKAARSAHSHRAAAPTTDRPPDELSPRPALSPGRLRAHSRVEPPTRPRPRPRTPHSYDPNSRFFRST